jgi:hypothetical protein
MEFIRGLLGKGNAIGHDLSWLARTFQLTSSADVPREIATGRALPVYDLVQRGFPVAAYGNADGAFTAAVNNHPLIPADSTKSRLVIAGSMLSASASTETVDLSISLANGTASWKAVEADIATNDGLGWNDLNHGRPLWVPPGFRLDANCNTLAGGDTLTVSILWVELPAGVAPW